MPPAVPTSTSADDAHQDRAHEGDVGCVEVVYPMASQHAQRDRRADDENDLKFLSEGALLAEEQHAKTARAHEHTADGRRNTQADQQGNENEFLVQNQLSVVSCQLHNTSVEGAQLFKNCHPERSEAKSRDLRFVRQALTLCYLLRCFHRRLFGSRPSGAPPCAISRLPPPRVPSACTACFISAPMSLPSPGVCAKTSDGCAPPQARNATHGPAFVSFCASILMKLISRSAKYCTTSFCAPRCSADLQHLRGLQLRDLLQQAMLRLLRGFALFLRFTNLLRYLPDVGREQCSGFRQRLEVASGRGDRAHPADELDASALPHLLGFAQQDGADLAGAAHVRTAAGVQVEVADVDQAQLLALGRQESCARPWCALLQESRNESQPDGLRRSLRWPVRSAALSCFALTVSVARSMVQLSSPM